MGAPCRRRGCRGSVGACSRAWRGSGTPRPPPRPTCSARSGRPRTAARPRRAALWAGSCRARDGVCCLPIRCCRVPAASAGQALFQQQRAFPLTSPSSAAGQAVRGEGCCACREECLCAAAGAEAAAASAPRQWACSSRLWEGWRRQQGSNGSPAGASQSGAGRRRPRIACNAACRRAGGPVADAIARPPAGAGR